MVWGFGLAAGAMITSAAVFLVPGAIGHHPQYGGFGIALGLLVGTAFFPPARGVLPLAGLPSASYLYSFLGAAGVSAVVAVALSRVRDADYDFGRLSREIRRLDDSTGGDRP